MTGEYESGNSVPKVFMKQTVDSFRDQDRTGKANTKYIKKENTHEIYQIQNQTNF